MRFLYVLRPTRLEMLTVGPSAEEQMIITRHAEHLHRLADEGAVHHFGRTMNNDEKTIGLVVFDAADLQAAEEVMHSDPAVEGKVMRAELFPYHQLHPK